MLQNTTIVVATCTSQKNKLITDFNVEQRRPYLGQRVTADDNAYQ